MLCIDSLRWLTKVCPSTGTASTRLSIMICSCTLCVGLRVVVSVQGKHQIMSQEGFVFVCVTFVCFRFQSACWASVRVMTKRTDFCLCLILLSKSLLEKRQSVDKKDLFGSIFLCLILLSESSLGKHQNVGQQTSVRLYLRTIFLRRHKCKEGYLQQKDEGEDARILQTLCFDWTVLRVKSEGQH